MHTSLESIKQNQAAISILEQAQDTSGRIVDYLGEVGKNCKKVVQMELAPRQADEFRLLGAQSFLEAARKKLEAQEVSWYALQLLGDEIKAMLQKAFNRLSQLEGQHWSAHALLLTNEYDECIADSIADYLTKQAVHCEITHPSSDMDLLSRAANADFVLVFGGPKAPLTGEYTSRLFGDCDSFDKLYIAATDYYDYWHKEIDGKHFFLIAGEDETIDAANKFIVEDAIHPFLQP